MRCRQTRPSEFFRPRRAPTGIWLQFDDFTQSPTWDNLKDHSARPAPCLGVCADAVLFMTHTHTGKRQKMRCTYGDLRVEDPQMCMSFSGTSHCEQLHGREP